jgi:hypothetical protein
MPTTSEYIATTFGVSIAQAHDFIMTHVSDPAYIYNMSRGVCEAGTGLRVEPAMTTETWGAGCLLARGARSAA